MSIEHLIHECGGIENIRRVLAPDSRLIAEVFNPDLVVGKCQKDFNSTLNQITFSSEYELNKQELLDMDKMIAEQQRLHSLDCEIPVECEFRPGWHISPPQGLINDPNGFIFHQGKYHLFYQWSPYSCEHRDKYWAHLTSEDLINWSWNPVALTPSAWCDSHGVFSGHAVSRAEELMLFYTGNVRIDEQRDRHTTQCLAVSKDGIHFEKYGPVITELPPGVTPHFRDPKVVQWGDSWLMLLGAQTEELKGRLAVYYSNDLYNWSLSGIFGEELGDFGYMWECPDMFELGGQLFVVIGPQGIESPSRFHTIPHHNGFVKASFDDNGKLTLRDFENLDHGFDFYAPQTALTEDGRRILSGWMGLPDEIDHPSCENGWVHQLTGLRELNYKDGKLLQLPIKEMQALRQDSLKVELDSSDFDMGLNRYELDIELEWGSELHLFKDEQHALRIRLDKQTHILSLNREKTLMREGDTVRELYLSSGKVSLKVLVDTSSVEVYINHGEFVMTSRVFVPKSATKISLNGKATANLWKLAQASAPFAKK